MTKEPTRSHQDLQSYQKAFFAAIISDEILAILVKIINNPEPWLLKKS